MVDFHHFGLVEPTLVTRKVKSKTSVFSGRQFKYFEKKKLKDVTKNYLLAIEEQGWLF